MTETANESGAAEPTPDSTKFVAKPAPGDIWDPMQDVTTPQGEGAGVTHSASERAGGAVVRTTERS